MINTTFFIFVDILQAHKTKHVVLINILKGVFKLKHRNYPTLHFCHCFLFIWKDHGVIWSQQQEEPQNHNTSSSQTSGIRSLPAGGSIYGTLAPHCSFKSSSVSVLLPSSVGLWELLLQGHREPQTLRGRSKNAAFLKSQWESSR